MIMKITKQITFPNNRPGIDLGDIEKTRNTLEYKTIVFTVVLYFFICFALLGVHYAAPYLPLAPALLEESKENEESKKEISGDIKGGTGVNYYERSSSGSPHNPHNKPPSKN